MTTPAGEEEATAEATVAVANAAVIAPVVEEHAVSLAALQEASTMVLDASSMSFDNNKRKAEYDVDDAAGILAPPPPSQQQLQQQPPMKRARAAPTRVSWEDRIAMLKAYKEEHGNLLIPIRYKLNPSLGKFVHNTREQFKLFHKRCPPNYKKKCSLTAERIAQLDEIGFVWSTERTKRQNEDWETRFGQLKAYKEEHGDCLVPHGYSADPSFAEWIHRQRTTYASMLKSDKPNLTVKERMDKLAGIGFQFQVHSDKWMDHWQQLKIYKEKRGNCQVPTHYADNPKLGRWVHTQRHQRRLQLKGKKSCMTQDRVDLLDQLGFSWEVRPGLERPRATWQQRYDELREFFLAHGHFKIPAETHPELHNWAQEQRARLRALISNKSKDIARRMAPDRVRALQELGFTKDTGLDAQLPETLELISDKLIIEEFGVTNEEQAAATAVATKDMISTVANERAVAEETGMTHEI